MGCGVIIIIIIIIDVVNEYVFFCKVGPKEYTEGEAVKMYIRLKFFFFFWFPKQKGHCPISLIESPFMVYGVHSRYI